MFGKYEKELIDSRDSSSDIGSTSKQKKYTGTEQVIKANFKRVQESLRVLEEYARFFDGKTVQKVKKLRFSAYTLEKQLKN